MKFPNQNHYRYSTFGLNIGIAFILFVWGGNKIDEIKGTDYWAIVGLFLALFYGAYQIWTLIRETKYQLGDSLKPNTHTP